VADGATGHSTDVESYLTIGRGTTLLVLGTVVLFIASFASRVLIANGLSLADWGAFNVALALIGFASTVALLGIDQAAARTLSFERDPAVRRAVVRRAVFVAVATAAVASLAVDLLAGPLAAAFATPVLATVLPVGAIAVGTTILGLLLAALFQGCEDAAPNAVFNQVVNPTLFVGFTVVALALHGGLVGILAAYAAASSVALVAFFGYALARLPDRIPAVAGPVPPVPRLARLAASFWGVGSLAFATAFVDTLILGLVRPSAEVGIYAAAMLLGRILLVGNGALTYIYLPVAARLARTSDVAGLRATYLAGTRWSLLLVTPAMLVFLVLPGASLRVLFGPLFESGTLPLQILTVGAFLSVLAGPANACLAGLGETRRLLGTTAVSASANAALSLGLTPVYGAVGGAVAWAVARALYPGIGLLVLRRKLGITIAHSSLVRPLALTVGICVPLFVAVDTLSPSPWVVFPLGLLAFGISGASLLATRSVLPGDLAIVHGIEALTGRSLPRVRRLLHSRLSPTVEPVRALPAGGA
jgi:O-antigen/teichoic acid export membrane protein